MDWKGDKRKKFIRRPSMSLTRDSHKIFDSRAKAVDENIETGHF